MAIKGSLASTEVISKILGLSPSMNCTSKLRATPIKKSNSGAANQATRAIFPSPFLAIVELAMTSPIAFPQASMVIAKKEGGKPKIIPRRAIASTKIPAMK